MKSEINTLRLQPTDTGKAETVDQWRARTGKDVEKLPWGASSKTDVNVQRKVRDRSVRRAQEA